MSDLRGFYSIKRRGDGGSGDADDCNSFQDMQSPITPPTSDITTLNFLQAGCLSCYPMYGVKALKAYEAYEVIQKLIWYNWSKWKSAQRRCRHCVLAIVRRCQKFPLLQTPSRGAWDGQNLISWRWSLPLPTNPVWWGSIHAISSYHGNRPIHTNTHTHAHTDRTDYNTLRRS